jgi:hypothetical protein
VVARILHYVAPGPREVAIIVEIVARRGVAPSSADTAVLGAAANPLGYRNLRVYVSA